MHIMPLCPVETPTVSSMVRYPSFGTWIGVATVVGANWRQVPNCRHKVPLFHKSKRNAWLVEYRRKMVEENFSIQPQPALQLDDDIKEIESFVFYPLQVNNDEVLQLSRFRQFEAIQAVANLARATRRHVVFKRHPLCVSHTIEALLRELKKNPFVHVSVGSVNALIQACSSVIVTNSGVGLQSLILQKPVYSLGRSEYAHMTIPIERLMELQSAFETQQERQPERVVRQLGYLLDEYLVDVRDRDRIAARVSEHVNRFLSHTDHGGDVAQSAELSASKVFLTVAHSLQKQVKEQVDYLVSIYNLLDDDRKEQAAQALARIAREKEQLRRIIPHTDFHVSGRCMRYFIAKGQWTTADALADLLVTHQPNGTAAALQTLSAAYYTKDRDERWLHHARACVEAKDARATNFVFLAQRQLNALGKPDHEIRELVAKALGIDSTNARAYWLKGRIAFLDGDEETARKSITEACRLDPGNQVFADLAERLGSAQKPRPEPLA